jgi:ribonuclease J
VDAKQVGREPGAYILCLSYWDITNLVDIGPDGGTYLFSASEAYDEDQRIDHKRLENWLGYFGLKNFGGLPNAEKGPYHASGHIDGPSLEALIEEIGAERIVPVHTQELGWFERRWAEKVVPIAYGVAQRVG